MGQEVTSGCLRGGGGGYRGAEGHSGQCRAGRGSTPPEEQEADLPPLGSAGPTVSLELSAVPQEGPGPWQGEDHFCHAKP